MKVKVFPRSLYLIMNLHKFRHQLPFAFKFKIKRSSVLEDVFLRKGDFKSGIVFIEGFYHILSKQPNNELAK